VIPERDNIRLRIEEFGIVPAIRPRLHASAADDVLFAAETLNAAGIPIAEVNMTVPGAVDVISHLAKTFPKMGVGADLIDLETALGVGTELVPAEALRWRKEEQIQELSRRFINMVRSGRRERLARV